MEFEFCEDIASIGAARWDKVVANDYPFLRYEFLHALENASDNDSHPACCERSGWQPQHCAIYESGELIGVMPLYLKSHSYGEYIFDWAWADAYHRNGINYYPKLLSAIPYSPVTGPRLSLSDSAAVNSEAVYRQLCEQLLERCQQLDASSLHILFTDDAQSRNFCERGLGLRHSYQYHWFNGYPHTHTGQAALYRDFADFSEQFKSRKRKQLKRERAQVHAQGIEMRTLTGAALASVDWEQFYYFYQRTYAKRSGHGGYLPLAFFTRIAQQMPEQLVLVQAFYRGQWIAAALNLSDGQTLYGRYWGCSAEAEYLHFEACYYQGIEFCITNGLHKFDAGAQGEHKVQRGFVPVTTWSNHWIAHPEFRDAIDRYLEAEAQGIAQHLTEISASLPFKCTELAPQ